jgi:hypothetical protein
MSSRKKKQDRKKRLRKRQRGHPKSGLPESGLPKTGTLFGKDVVFVPSGDVKMSEVLWEFLEPYADHWENEDQLRKLLNVGIIAWNSALFSGKERAEVIDDMLRRVPPGARQDMRDLIMPLIQRKDAHFSGNRRMIVDYQLTMQPSGPYLVVASTPESV